MSEAQSTEQTPRRKRRTWKKKGIYTEPFHCMLSKGQMEALQREAERHERNIIDIIREGINMRCGIKPPGAPATPVPPLPEVRRT